MGAPEARITRTKTPVTGGTAPGGTAAPTRVRAITRTKTPVTGGTAPGGTAQSSPSQTPHRSYWSAGGEAPLTGGMAPGGTSTDYNEAKSLRSPVMPGRMPNTIVAITVTPRAIASGAGKPIGVWSSFGSGRNHICLAMFR